MTACRITLTCMVVALAMPVSAQVQRQSATDDPARSQVQTFEMVLRAAVETGGQNFAKRAAQMVPVAFFPGDAPLVNGVAVREMGLYVFQVQVPTIWPTIQVINMMMNRGGAFADGPYSSNPLVGESRDASNRQRVSAAGTVTPDPMSATAAQEGDSNGAQRPDLEREYALQVRNALIDAMVDNSGGLPLGPDDTLLVIAAGTDPVVPNPLYRSTARKLVLSVKGSDIAELRQGRISRDEARARIKEAHF